MCKDTDGALGSIFGRKQHAPTNIVGIVVVMFVLASILSLFVDVKLTGMPFIEKVLPVISMALGYMFGKTKNE